ncbi:hypothetical protein BC941DRAFT_431321 [Chlamydoabsidia padenii]|nr:hypothetical protein BC941DRAFT_431321 [Chlamydoabsidia padenii]
MSELTCTLPSPYNNKSEDHSPDSSNATLYELHQVIQQYQAQPELLKLILVSKVEEDKRRAEEAKLRAKELDYYLQHDTSLPPIQQPSKRKMSIPSRIKITSAPYPTSQPDSPLSPSFDDHRRHSAANAMLAMGRSVSPCTLPSSPPSDEESNHPSAAYPSPVMDTYEDQDNKPRRRREMQAITKIVETRDFPYLDQYFWRNNGNTTQKKTGCRSIYYKCSNSNKGCQVNKTVTAKQNGEYLIKYRGIHLPECGMVERIRDV